MDGLNVSVATGLPWRGSPLGPGGAIMAGDEAANSLIPDDFFPGGNMKNMLF